MCVQCAKSENARKKIIKSLTGIRWQYLIIDLEDELGAAPVHVEGQVVGVLGVVLVMRRNPWPQVDQQSERLCHFTLDTWPDLSC